jgi:hypothetical protein
MALSAAHALSRVDHDGRARAVASFLAHLIFGAALGPRRPSQ